MKKYIILKNKKKRKTKIDIDKISGYRVLPKNSFEYPGMKVESLIVIKPNLIEKLLKKKIKRKLDYYLNYIISLIEDDDDDGTSYKEALDEISRYRELVEYRYRLYLDDKYINILLKKISLIEYEIKCKTIKPKKERKKIFNEEKEEIRHKRR